MTSRGAGRKVTGLHPAGVPLVMPLLSVAARRPDMRISRLDESASSPSSRQKSLHAMATEGGVAGSRLAT
jgi:hypothetical protein